MFDIFEGREVDTGGLEVRKGSKTFRWHGSYVQDMNEAVTVEVDLNVLAERAEDPTGLPGQQLRLPGQHPSGVAAGDAGIASLRSSSLPTR